MTSKRAHEAAVRRMTCVVTRRSPVTLHHCHGGSLREEYPHLARGKGQKVSDWLVIPIVADIHTGPMGIDGFMGVSAWEAMFGRQTDFLRQVSEAVGYDVFTLAEEEACSKLPYYQR